METMSKKKLKRWQLEDAERLKQVWGKYKVSEGISQEELVDRLGWLNQSAFSQFINGSIPLNMERAIDFSRFFGVALVEISPHYSDKLAGVAEDSGEYLIGYSYGILNDISGDHEAGKLTDDDLAAIGEFADYRKSLRKKSENN